MRPLPFLVPLLAILTYSGTAAAHAGNNVSVEMRFPMPPWLPWVAGGLVVAVSFLIVALFVGRDPATGHGKPLPAVEPLLPETGGNTAQIVATLVLLTLIATAFLPRTGPFPDVLLWTLVWAGLATLAYTVGDVWDRISPFRLLGRATSRLRGGRPPARYPKHLGAWPSVVLLLALIGAEVTDDLGHGARSIGTAVAAYTLLTLLGMYLFGAGTWPQQAEVFGRAFRWWGASSPFRREQGRLRLGLPGARLDALPVLGAADVAFTVGLLYGVNHDAFANGPPGRALHLAMAGHLAEPWASLVLLVGGYLAFLLVFVVCASSMHKASKTLLPAPVVATRFAASLVPIAVGYHLAHHLPLYLESVPAVLTALGDPFALGWDPLGVRGAVLDVPSRVLATFSYLQVAFILTGHVLAVVAAHRLAVRLFPSRVQAFRAEIPLTAVMVLYTLVGLWLASGASVGGGAA